MQQPSSWKAFLNLNQSARVQIPPPPNNRVLEILVLMTVTGMLRSCAMSIGAWDLEAKLLENLHHYLASSPPGILRLLACKSSNVLRNENSKQLQQPKHKQQHEMSSILFGDTMVRKNRVRSYLPFGYSTLYKEYYLTRFNHQKTLHKSTITSNLVGQDDFGMKPCC